ncbi:MAG: hypothetical protein M3Z04_22815 [Chloroflexota bacterium]|nr:hypothetical protein [Chloroflexota bacterium]
MNRHWIRQSMVGTMLVMGGALAAWPVAAAPLVAPPARPPAQGIAPSQAFLRLWARADWPLTLKLVQRAWVWGPKPLATISEAYSDAPGGQRLVQYWDKARMEVTNPGGNPNDPGYITNGLLVVELVGGRMQTGNTQYEQRPASNEVVVGDNRAANPDAPSYAAMRGVASLAGDNTFPDRSGQPVTGYMDARGVTNRSDTLLGYGVRYSHYVPQTGHNIPDKFWNYLQQQAPIYQDGQLVTAPLYNWVPVAGYPISDAYWLTARIGGKQYAVLTQLYQRRVLTYIPAFAPEWQIQMGNVGQHYYAWRYGTK